MLQTDLSGQGHENRIGDIMHIIWITLTFANNWIENKFFSAILV